MSARRDTRAVRTSAVLATVLIGLQPLSACAEIEVGIEAAKRANRLLTSAPAPEAPAQQETIRIAQAQTGTQTDATQSAVSPYLEPAPEIFEATGRALWDGKRTLQGIWVAHPLATTARRVRIFNTTSGQSVDGALFKRDAALGGTSVLISSEAAQRLGMRAGESAELRIVAVTPVRRTNPEPTTAEEVADDQTATPVENTPVTEAEPAETEPTPTPTDQAEVPAQPEPEPEPEVPVTAQAEEESESVAAAPTSPQPRPRPEPSESSEEEGEFRWERASSEPAATPEAEAEPEPEPEPEAPAQPQPAEEEAPAQPTQTASTPSPLSKPYVQAGVFGVSANANKLVKRLKAKGLPALGRSVTSGGRTLTRVLAGPFQTSAERAAAQKTIREMGLRDAVPVRR